MYSVGVRNLSNFSSVIEMLLLFDCSVRANVLTSFLNEKKVNCYRIYFNTGFCQDEMHVCQ